MKKFFAKGLIALLPIVLTAVVLYFVVSFVYGNIGVPIGQALRWSVVRLFGEERAALLYPWLFPFVGFAVGIFLTLMVGFLVATFVGRKLYKFFEKIFSRLPVIRIIYPYARQFTDFFFSGDQKMEFKHAVALPFPAPGLYSIGFVTSEGMKALNEVLHKHLVCVFVPTSPTPFTGYVVYVPREDVIPLPISVEEAMRIIISAGVLHPAHQAVTPADVSPGGESRLPVQKEQS